MIFLFETNTVKFLLIACLILAPALCAAASPEDGYLAAREAAVAAIKTLDDAKKGDDALKLQDTEKVALTAKLRPIIGPVAIKGFAATGTANIGSLFPGDMDSGLLDGLIYPAPDDKSFLIVTTETLLKHWLIEHKDWWGPKVDNVPQQIPATLASNAFYTQALQTDAAISRYAELPVNKPAGAQLAIAMLVARSQILDPSPPDEVLVAMVRDGRVFIVSAPAAVKAPMMPACLKIWKDSQRAANAAQQAYVASELKDAAQSDRREKIEEDGAAAFLRCFAQRAGGQPFFAPLVKQAQAIVDRLAMK